MRPNVDNWNVLTLDFFYLKLIEIEQPEYFFIIIMKLKV